MGAVLYKGRVMFADGTTNVRIFKKTAKYYIDERKNWFRVEDGRKTSLTVKDNGVRLLLHSLKLYTETAVASQTEFPYKAQIKGATGQARWTRLRTTKTRHFDDAGNSYHKATGWSYQYDNNKLRLLIETIQLAEEPAN